jgi:hypothetical protein
LEEIKKHKISFNKFYLTQYIKNTVSKCNQQAECGGANLQSQLLGRLRQEDLEFEGSLGNLARPCPKIK